VSDHNQNHPARFLPTLVSKGWSLALRLQKASILLLVHRHFRFHSTIH
jgi:hypothetical protein